MKQYNNLGPVDVEKVMLQLIQSEVFCAKNALKKTRKILDGKNKVNIMKLRLIMLKVLIVQIVEKVYLIFQITIFSF